MKAQMPITTTATTGTTIATMRVTEFECDVDGEEETLLVGVLVEVLVIEGGLVRDAGELLFRHDDSCESRTVKTFVVPPCRPWESVMKNSNCVPAATFAIQSKLLEPVGGLSTKVEPPGTRPCGKNELMSVKYHKKTLTVMVTGWVALS